eukprot:m.21468 g.21468  ORF g.21468 m.21468 type:complete len:226 (+) comp28177_c0_seq1:655-1332(+)
MAVLFEHACVAKSTQVWRCCTRCTLSMADSGKRSSKVILLGEPGVGKTSIFRRLNDGTFSERSTVTAGRDQMDWEYRDGNTAVILRIEDTGGMEKRFTFTSGYYRDASAVVYVYAVNDWDSLDMITDWADKAATRGSSSAHAFLVGNKTDLIKRVKKEDIARVAEAVGIKEKNMFQVSCKSGEGIEKAFISIASVINKDPVPSGNEHDILDPPKDKPSNEKGRCC